MRLLSQKVALVVLVSSIACHDATGPVRVSEQFTLANINGRQLPTYLWATPAPTLTILESTLTLDRSGKANILHRVRTGETQWTATETYDYVIQGNMIEIGTLEPCVILTDEQGLSGLPEISDFCATGIGIISNDGLSLVMYPRNPDGPLHFDYRVPLTL